MKLNHAEYKLCVAVHRILDAYGLSHTHVVNEQPDPKRAALENRMGKVKGVPDYLIFACPPGAIEVKTQTGIVSVEQTRMLAHLSSLGWATAVVRSIDDLVEFLDKNYLRPA